MKTSCAGKKPILEMVGISKVFNNKPVLQDINLPIYRGEVTCVLGKNGAGKSVLMNILMGIIPQDRGSVFWEGKSVDIRVPQDAYNLEMSMVFQEPMLMENMTVGENIFIYSDPGNISTPIVNRKRIYEEAEKLFRKIGFDIDPHARVNSLSYAKKQMVSIAKAIAAKPKVLIMDEPTTSLVEKDTRKLFAMMDSLKKAGVAIIYISHHIGEVVEIADRIVVLRDSEIIDMYEYENGFEIDDILYKMTGEILTNRYPRISSFKGDVILNAAGLGIDGIVKDINFSIREGEIIGVFGLEGSGKEYLGKMMYGLARLDEGTISIYGEEMKTHNPQNSLKRGITYLSEEFAENLILKQDIPFNITIGNLGGISHGFYISGKKNKAVGDYFIDKFKIHNGTFKQSIMRLSGGSKQKVAISKCLFTDTSLMILEEVSKYIDIAAKVELYNILNKLVANGIGILFISSDVEELIGMCDRILVFYKKTVIRELISSETTPAEVLFYASEGGKRPV